MMKTKIYSFFRKCARRCVSITRKAIQIVSIDSFAKIFENKMRKKAFFVLALLSIIGFIINTYSQKTLPYFYFLFSLLVACLCITYCTTQEILNSYKEIDALMVGDATLLAIRTKYKIQTASNIIYGPMFAFSIIVTYVAYKLIKAPIDWIILLYCFSGLFVVTFLCTYGAIQYYFLLLLIRRIKYKAHKIDNYDHVRPHMTQWLSLLSKLIQECNKRYLVVGFFLITAFSIFSMSNKFGINISSKHEIMLLGVFWFIILFFIIFGAIFCSFYSNYCIISVQNLFTSKLESSLIHEYMNSKQSDIKNSYAIRIMLLSNQTFSKISFKHIVTGLLSAVDTLASIQATVSLISMIINNNLM